jgi:lauroyl/myristoyl acyltransferase
VTQSLAVRLESVIGEAPEQWHLVVPNWPSDDKGA